MFEQENYLNYFPIFIGLLIILFVSLYIRNKYKNEKNFFRGRKKIYDKPIKLPHRFYRQGEEINLDHVEKETYHN